MKPVSPVQRIASLLFLLSTVWAATASAQGKFSGYMFGDYFYNVERDTVTNRSPIPRAALPGQKDLQAFQFRRIYFTYDNDISEKFTSRFRLEADQSALSSDGKISVFVKDAWLRWKDIFAGSDFYFGMQPTAAYEISEAAWGYRSLEKTIMDLRGINPSRELGVALRGRLDEPGVFNYWAIVSNSGSGNVPNGMTTFSDKYKRYALLFHVKPGNALQLTLYGQYRGAPAVNDPSSTVVPRATVGSATITGAAFIGYRLDTTFSAGVEGFLQSTAHGYLPPAPAGRLRSLKAMGISVFGAVNFSPVWGVVARYDYFDPNADTEARGDVRHFMIGSLVYRPHRNVSIMPNVLVEAYEAPAGSRALDPSVTARMTFYYVFL